MEELNELRDMVEKLGGLTEKYEIVKQLQEIGKYILNNCYFDFGNNQKIYPLWIEAYYYKNEVFEDEFCHKCDYQKGKDRFGKPYFHSGVDVCLPLGDYYLSYLIKVSYDNNGELYSQKELEKIIKDKNPDQEIIRLETNTRKVDNYYRIGLFANHDMRKLFYQESLLSSYFDLTEIDNDNKSDIIKQTIQNITLNKESFVKDYLKRHYDDVISAKSPDDIKETTKKLVGYKMQSLFDDSNVFDEKQLPILYLELIKY